MITSFRQSHLSGQVCRQASLVKGKDVRCSDNEAKQQHGGFHGHGGSRIHDPFLDVILHEINHPAFG